MAFKVFTSWDKAQDGKEHRKMKQQPSHLAEVLLGELEAKKKKKRVIPKVKALGPKGTKRGPQKNILQKRHPNPVQVVQ